MEKGQDGASRRAGRERRVGRGGPVSVTGRCGPESNTAPYQPWDLGQLAFLFMSLGFPICQMGVMTACLWGMCQIHKLIHDTNHVAILEKTGE